MLGRMAPSEPAPPAPTLISGFQGDVRKTWPREARDLTPWVREHLPELAGQLGLQLEFVGQEVAVGDFLADIEARDEQGRKVLIENQFGPTDHIHLGQIVLYACEARADIVVWVAAGTKWFRRAPIRPEHRRALTVLNERFAGVTRFYGVQLVVSSEPRPISEPRGPMIPRFTRVV